MLKRLLVLGGVVGIAAVAVVLIARASDGDRVPAEWALAGVGVDGQSLAIVSVDDLSLCEWISGRARRVPGDQTVVEVWKHRESCDDEAPSVGVSQAPRMWAIPVDGPTVRRALELPDGTRVGRPPGDVVPGVQGLSVRLACAVGEANGLAVEVRGRTPHPSATVTDQQPAGWSPKTAARTLTLMTGQSSGDRAEPSSLCGSQAP